MRKAMCALVAAATLTLASAQAVAEDSVVGVWKVTKFEQKLLDDGKVFEPFGAVKGIFIFTKGHYSRIVTAANRPVNGVPPSDAEVSSLFKSMFAYSGSYAVAGTKLTMTSRDVAWREEWVAKGETDNDLVFSGNMLTITTSPFTNAGGKRAIAIVSMERVE